jgi:protein-disulfide isomerase
MLDSHLLSHYEKQVAFIHRDFPLEKHVWARKAAIVARYFSGENPKVGIEFRQFMMGGIPNATPENFNDRVTKFSKAHHHDPSKALAALDDEKLAALVEKDVQDGVARGVSKTPTVFVNGKPFVETFSVEEISRAIDQAITESR